MLTTVLKKMFHAKRLCPLMGLALAFGCGKKINDPQSSSPNGSIQNNILPTTLSLQLVESESSVSHYTLPRDGIFELPQQLVVMQGSGAFKNIKISYNMDANGDYEFHCIYKSTGQTKVLPLLKCEDPQGGSFGDISGQSFPMDQGKQIEMKLTNPSTHDLTVDAIFEVKWL